MYIVYHWKHVTSLELADRDRVKYDSRLDFFRTNSLVPDY